MAEPLAYVRMDPGNGIHGGWLRYLAAWVPPISTMDGML